MASPLKIKVILGSIRPNRFGEKPAKWIAEYVKNLPDVDVELLDLKDYPMPLFNDAVSPSMHKGPYENKVIDAWAQKITEADAFIIVSPEYNRGTSAVLKNALDWVYTPWNNKAVGFISYGSAGGARAVEQLRLNAIELQMAPVRQGVHIFGHVIFPIQMGKAQWTAETEKGLQDQADKMLAQLTKWGRAMKGAREK